MSYADRLATINGTTPTRTIEIFGATYPAIRLDQGNSGSPLFYSQGLTRGDGIEGWLEHRMYANFPCVFIDSNPTEASNSDYINHGGIYVYGYSAGDYAIKQAGTVIPDYGGFFVAAGVNSGLSAYIDGCYFGFRATTHDIVFWPDPDFGNGDRIGIEYSIQSLGVDFTGGTASPVTLNALSQAEVNPGYGVGAGNITFHADHFACPTLASTEADPECLFWYQVEFDGTGTYPNGRDNSVMLGFKIAADGTVTSGLTMFEAGSDPDVANCDGVHAVCISGGNYHVIRDANGTGGVTQAYTVCDEAGNYGNYRPGFDHADLPTYLDEITLGTNSAYSFVSLQGTDEGFLLSYKKQNGLNWDPKYVLVSADWQTFQFIDPSPLNLIATEIVDQSNGGNNLASQVNAYMKGGTFYLIGGTTAEPKVAALQGDASGNTDDDIRLRVWTFSLDGHDYFVLRIGIRETLSLDLTTGQWAHWASPGEEIWRAHVGQNWIGIGPTTVARGFGTDIVAGDDRTGILWMLDPSVGLDDDPVDGNPAVAFERKVTGGIQLSGRETRPCGAIQLTTAMGNPQETGASYTLRISDDHGNSWLNCGTVATVAGNYSTVVEWRGLGLMKAPGRVFEVSDSGASVRLSRLDLR